MNPKPSQNLPPIRMGHRTDLARHHKAQEQAQHKVAAQVRKKIYQDLLALLDIAERMTLDFSGPEDRYGLDWHALARQIRAHYRDDVLTLIPGVQAMIMSKEGAQGLPKGLYRQLLDFVEGGGEFLKWVRNPNADESGPDPSESQFIQACKRFQKSCLEMQQHICIFENERDAGEESFFG